MYMVRSRGRATDHRSLWDRLHGRRPDHRVLFGTQRTPQGRCRYAIL